MASKTTRKPSAADRTVDLFSKKTSLEVAQEVARIAAAEDIQQSERAAPEPLEECAERWRLHAFRTQEWTTKNFPGTDEQGSQFRLTRGLICDRPYYYLERLHNHSGKSVSSYAGVMIPEADLFALTDVIVAAARDMKNRSGQ